MPLTLRTDDRLERALDTLAADEGLSRQEIIRRAVLERYERAGHARRVVDSTDRMIERWDNVLEDLVGLVRRLDVGPVRDIGLLDAAVARPRPSAFGVAAYPSIERKAAALLHSLVGNHALADGNKRLGWLATVVFLDINRQPVELDDDDAFDLVVEIAEGLLDVAQIADRLGRG